MMGCATVSDQAAALVRVRVRVRVRGRGRVRAAAFVPEVVALAGELALVATPVRSDVGLRPGEG